MKGKQPEKRPEVTSDDAPEYNLESDTEEVPAYEESSEAGPGKGSEKHPVKYEPFPKGKGKEAIRTDDAPPTYSEAASSSNPVVHDFIRRHSWSSSVFVQSDGVDRYCFSPGKDSQIWIYAGASTKNTPLGYLTFPFSHNAFRLYFGAGEEGKPGPSGSDANGFAFSDVKARIGYPHPSNFSFKSDLSGYMRDYEWKNRSPSEDVTPVVYDLSASSVEPIATLTVNKKGKGATSVKWLASPKTELEQAIVIMSAIGVITRSWKKGSYRSSDLPGSHKWFTFWWMSALAASI
ncbi:hypothetical protein Q7P37_005623 [Cladosporium fusiforme]